VPNIIVFQIFSNPGVVGSSAWLGWDDALALRAVSRDACALVASHHRMLRWLLSDVLPPVMACSTDRVPFPTDSPRAALSLLAGTHNHQQYIKYNIHYRCTYMV
jgi:hypothetical protein